MPQYSEEQARRMLELVVAALDIKPDSPPESFTLLNELRDNFEFGVRLLRGGHGLAKDIESARIRIEERIKMSKKREQRKVAKKSGNSPIS